MITYSETATLAREVGATLDQADDARFAAMAGTVDGRMVYDAERYRAVLEAN
jgi:hypothetical protein